MTSSPTLSLMLWLAYAGQDGGITAELELAPQMPALQCQVLLARVPEPEILGTLGSIWPKEGETALELVLRKKRLHPKMEWGFQCISVDGA